MLSFFISSNQFLIFAIDITNSINSKNNTIMAKWVCPVCGYVHEGDKLPEDFICPLCKHGADDFEKL